MDKEENKHAGVARSLIKTTRKRPIKFTGHINRKDYIAKFALCWEMIGKRERDRCIWKD